MTNANTKPASAPQKRKIVIFSDFDGTICMQDTGHVLVDNYGCGAAARGEFEREIKTGSRSFREVSNDMWGSLTIPFEDGFDIMEKSLTMDPGFKEFHHYCVDNGFPFNVISAGLKPVLRRVLNTFLGEEDSSTIEIVANDAVIPTDGSKWLPVWRHNVDSGIDKALSVDEGRAQALAQCDADEMPLIIFIGDGVSDLAAARQADVLFARQGLALEKHCQDNNIPFTPFVSFVDIKSEIEKISREDQAKTGGVGKPVRYNPRANMWRRISSKEALPTLMAAATPTKEEKMFLWPETFSEPKPATINENKATA